MSVHMGSKNDALGSSEGESLALKFEHCNKLLYEKVESLLKCDMCKMSHVTKTSLTCSTAKGNSCPKVLDYKFALPPGAKEEATAILDLYSPRGCLAQAAAAKNSTGPSNRASSVPTQHGGQHTIADLFSSKVVSKVAVAGAPGSSLGSVGNELNLPDEDDVDSNTPTNTQAL
ncbi:hypothetical protein BC830DRAFT_1084510 [Chytriomyces sp. MP71]|nr:hypothetical protein BC830DRAFT_1084510 [Chytriomyces sp. MP71]